MIKDGKYHYPKSQTTVISSAYSNTAMACIL